MKPPETDPDINNAFADPARMAHYEAHFRRPEREIYHKRNEIIACCSLSPNDRVADVGCGTGEFSLLFATQVSQLFVIDLFPHFVDHTLKQLGGSSCEVHGMVSNGAELGLPPESLELIFVCNTYHHFEHPFEMLRSMKRVLAPKGRLVLVDIHPETMSNLDGTPHVRADREAFCEEFVSQGFERAASPSTTLQSAYLEIFHQEKTLMNIRPQPSLALRVEFPDLTTAAF